VLLSIVTKQTITHRWLPVFCAPLALQSKSN